jgi:hypothetical protein
VFGFRRVHLQLSLLSALRTYSAFAAARQEVLRQAEESKQVVLAIIAIGSSDWPVCSHRLVPASDHGQHHVLAAIWYLYGRLSGSVHQGPLGCCPRLLLLIWADVQPSEESLLDSNQEMSG